MYFMSLGILNKITVGTNTVANRMRFNQLFIINVNELDSKPNVDFFTDLFNGNRVLTCSKLDHRFSLCDTVSLRLHSLKRS